MQVSTPSMLFSCAAWLQVARATSKRLAPVKRFSSPGLGPRLSKSVERYEQASDQRSGTCLSHLLSKAFHDMFFCQLLLVAAGCCLPGSRASEGSGRGSPIYDVGPSHAVTPLFLKEAAMLASQSWSPAPPVNLQGVQAPQATEIQSLGTSEHPGCCGGFGRPKG